MGIFIDFTLALLMFLSPSFVFGIENVEEIRDFST